MKGNLVVLELLKFGLSQMQIAQRAGVSQTTVSCLKRGVRNACSYEKVVALEMLLEAVRAEKAATPESAQA
ncbi:helix-turn-helix domain-containing protein [Paraburkholderia xenovorans]|nr:helix-turn-helix domain-containing protein [Paraburkholderia xenovorans]